MVINIRAQIKEAMDLLGVDYFPSRLDLEKAGLKTLASRVEKHGGYTKLAKEYCIPSKGHRIQYNKWSIEAAKERILDITKALSLERMPTRKEMLDYEGDGELTSYISRSYGFYGFANMLGLSIKDSETTTGKKAEYEVADMLRTLGYRVSHMTQNYPYDLLINNNVKVDVKFSNLFRGNGGNFYRFSWEKPYPTCDIYILVSSKTKSGEGNIFRIVPSCHISNTSGIGIGEYDSIYNVYIDQWEYIDKYLDFYEGISEFRCSA